MKYLLCIVLTLSIAFLVSQSEPINADNETGDSSIKPVEIESSVEKENHVSDNGSQIKRIPTLAENMSPSKGRKPVNFLMTEAATNMLGADSFNKFMKKFHRVYSGPAEFVMRQAVFTAKLLKIFMHNLKYYAGLVRYRLKIGPFADKTKAEVDALFRREDTPFFEEWMTKMGNESDPARTENKHDDDYAELQDDKDYGQTSGESRPNEMFVDHRYCFTPVKNQLQCGTCWAFAGGSMLEYYHCKQTGIREAVAFSEQYWLDCRQKFSHGTRVYYGGCQSGGDPRYLHLFAEQLGLLEEVYRPYVGEERSCENTTNLMSKQLGDVKVKVGRYLDIEDNIDLFLHEKIESDPIYVSMRVPTDFFDLGKGVHHGKKCELGLHAMVVVGHGIEDNEEFWLIRNSHGRDWADEGYWKLSKKADRHCFRYAFQWDGVHFPVVSQFVRQRSSSSSARPDSPLPSQDDSSQDVSCDQNSGKEKPLWMKLFNCIPLIDLVQ